LMVFRNFSPSLNANVLFFCRFLFESHPVYDQTDGLLLVLCFPCFRDNSNIIAQFACGGW
jgi:hypothetical protein